MYFNFVYSYGFILILFIYFWFIYFYTFIYLLLKLICRVSALFIIANETEGCCLPLSLLRLLSNRLSLSPGRQSSSLLRRRRRCWTCWCTLCCPSPCSPWPCCWPSGCTGTASRPTDTWTSTRSVSSPLIRFSQRRLYSDLSHLFPMFQQLQFISCVKRLFFCSLAPPSGSFDSVIGCLCLEWNTYSLYYRGVGDVDHVTCSAGPRPVSSLTAGGSEASAAAGG